MDLIVSEGDAKEVVDGFVAGLRAINANDALFEEMAIFARKSWEAFERNNFSTDSCRALTAALVNNLMPGGN